MINLLSFSFSSIRFIEYYDSRAANAAVDGMNGTDLNGGRIEAKLTWDNTPVGYAYI